MQAHDLDKHVLPPLHNDILLSLWRFVPRLSLLVKSVAVVGCGFVSFP